MSFVCLACKCIWACPWLHVCMWVSLLGYDGGHTHACAFVACVHACLHIHMKSAGVRPCMHSNMGVLMVPRACVKMCLWECERIANNAKVKSKIPIVGKGDILSKTLFVYRVLLFFFTTEYFLCIRKCLLLAWVLKMWYWMLSCCLLNLNKFQ